MENGLTMREAAEVPDIKTLDDLISELHKIFEHDHVDVRYVKAVLDAYKSNPREWRKYAKFDVHR